MFLTTLDKGYLFLYSHRYHLPLQHGRNFHKEIECMSKMDMGLIMISCIILIPCKKTAISVSNLQSIIHCNRTRNKKLIHFAQQTK